MQRAGKAYPSSWLPVIKWNAILIHVRIDIVNINKRHFKGLGSIVLVVLITALLASCQPVLGQHQPATSITIALEPVPPAQENTTPPPAASITVTPEPVSPSTPPPDTNITSAPTPVYPAPPNPTPQITPLGELHITGKAQDVDISTYRLTISGLVEKPLSLTYQNILAYPSVTATGVIDCPGFFTDIAEWTGVPLNTLLAEAGLKSGARWVTFYAVDGYQQTLSLEEINEESVFLAYKVNGQILPPEHGYPLRVAANGSVGAKWVKWLASIEVK